VTSTLGSCRFTELIATGGTNWRWVIFAAGAAAMIVPTLATVAAQSWSTEQGAHGPIVLAISIWLFVRAVPAMRAVATPGSALAGGIALGAMVLIYVGARVVGSIVIESVAMYCALVAALYLIVGWRALRAAWFPIAYFLFVLPPPGSWVATLTQPLRLRISAYAVDLLGMFGYPVAQTGLMIFVDQYALEVRAACSGLNSMISLSAIGLFYIYIRHNANLGYCALMSGIIICMALLANFVRVLILILITYYFGDGAAQGFLHVFAGMTMFAVALLGLMAVDELATRLQHRFAARGFRA
jgi:exosortase